MVPCTTEPPSPLFVGEKAFALTTLSNRPEGAVEADLSCPVVVFVVEVGRARPTRFHFLLLALVQLRWRAASFSRCCCEAVQ